MNKVLARWRGSDRSIGKSLFVFPRAGTCAHQSQRAQESCTPVTVLQPDLSSGVSSSPQVSATSPSHTLATFSSFPCLPSPVSLLQWPWNGPASPTTSAGCFGLGTQTQKFLSHVYLGIEPELKASLPRATRGGPQRSPDNGLELSACAGSLTQRLRRVKVTKSELHSTHTLSEDGGHR